MSCLVRQVNLMCKGYDINAYADVCRATVEDDSKITATKPSVAYLRSKGISVISITSKARRLRVLQGKIDNT